jgi:hypothetical protein
MLTTTAFSWGKVVGTWSRPKMSSKAEEIGDIHFAYMNQGVGSKVEWGI